MPQRCALAYQQGLFVPRSLVARSRDVPSALVSGGRRPTPTAISPLPSPSRYRTTCLLPTPPRPPFFLQRRPPTNRGSAIRSTPHCTSVVFPPRIKRNSICWPNSAPLSFELELVGPILRLSPPNRRQLVNTRVLRSSLRPPASYNLLQPRLHTALVHVNPRQRSL